MTILASRPPIAGASFLNEDLGLELVTAAVRDAGFDCRFHDGIQARSSPREWVQELSGASEDLLFVTLHAEAWADQVLSLLREVKKAAPHKTVVVGGHPVSTLDEAIFEHYPDAFDVLVRADGEDAAVQIARSATDDRASLGDVPGLSIRNGSRLTRTSDRQRSRDYDRLPFAARDVWENGLERPATGSALISFGRGCDYACKFCSVVTFYGRQQRHWAHRSIDLFLQEVDQVRTKHSVTDFTIVDPDFLGNPANGNRHVLELCQALEDARFDIIWDIAVRADQLDRQLLERMYAAGLRRVFLGLESGLQNDLAHWRKGLTPSRGMEAAGWCADIGIYAQIGFIMLRPESTLEDVRSNLGFLRRLPYFELFSLNAPLWLLHGVPATREIADRSIIQFHGRIQRAFVFDDLRVSSYSNAIHILIRAVAPHFMAMRETMWHTTAHDPAVLHRYREAMAASLAPCLDGAEQIVTAIGTGATPTALEERAQQCAAQAVASVSQVASRFR